MGYSYTTLEGNTGTDNSVQNAHNTSADYTLLPEDVRHALVLNEAYELPFGKGHWLLHDGKLTNAFVGGWTLSGVERYQSGFPLALVMSSNALPIFNYYQRPNLVAGVDPSSHISNHDFKPGISNVFNVAAFAAPGNNSFGNARPTYSNLRNFPVLTEDVQLTKQTQLTEKVTWSFYAQAFNPANRHRFAGIGTAYGASNFGQPNATTAARSLQFGTRLAF